MSTAPHTHHADTAESLQVGQGEALGKVLRRQHRGVLQMRTRHKSFQQRHRSGQTKGEPRARVPFCGPPNAYPSIPLFQTTRSQCEECEICFSLLPPDVSSPQRGEKFFHDPIVVPNPFAYRLTIDISEETNALSDNNNNARVLSSCSNL